MSQANELLHAYLVCHKDNILVPLYKKFGSSDNLLSAPLKSIEDAKNELRHDSSEYFRTLIHNVALFENRNRFMRMFLPAIYTNESCGLDDEKFNRIFNIILENTTQDLPTMINIIGKNYGNIPESEWLEYAENDYVCAYVSNMICIKLFHYITTEPEIFSSFKNIFTSYNLDHEETIRTFNVVLNEWANELLKDWQWHKIKESA